jgi:DNA-binding MarR family transcriptional regulator
MPHEDLNRTLGFLLHDASRLMRKRVDKRARALGLTRAQWRVLAQLRRREGINQTALADILEIENITMARHIDRLEDAGWVERRRDPGDRRAWRLYLTEPVQPILDQMRELSNETREEALAGLSPAQSEAIIEALITIKDNLCRAQASDSKAEAEDDDAATGTTG